LRAATDHPTRQLNQLRACRPRSALGPGARAADTIPPARREHVTTSSERDCLPSDIILVDVLVCPYLSIYIRVEHAQRTWTNCAMELASPARTSLRRFISAILLCLARLLCSSSLPSKSGDTATEACSDPIISVRISSAVALCLRASCPKPEPAPRVRPPIHYWYAQPMAVPR
jgi:hypothetical protein